MQNTDTYEYFEQSSEYLWGDGLLRYDSTEYNFYDAIGNPLTYNNGSAYTFAWSNGRQLTSGTKGSTSFAYTYNADGLRTQKVVDGVVTDYYWAGSQLAMMVITNGTSVKTLKFYYDAEGRPMCLDYNGTIYFYITNLQGDVVALSDQYGEVIRYEYDAWGKPLVSEYYFSSHSDAMQYNPLRYRGYIYDSETGFYYLQSRYYDPAVGRFISSDGVEYLGATGTFLSFNMFSYCENNPIMGYDPTGAYSWEQFWEEVQEMIADLHNDDGTYSLYDNHRKYPERLFHEQWFVWDPFLDDADATSSGLVWGGSFTLVTGGWEWEHIDLSLLDFARCEGEIGITSTAIFASTGFSLWSPSLALDAPGGELMVTANFGQIYGFKFGEKFEISMGVFSFSYQFD